MAVDPTTVSLTESNPFSGFESASQSVARYIENERVSSNGWLWE